MESSKHATPAAAGESKPPAPERDGSAGSDPDGANASRIDAQSSLFEGGNSINYHESHERGSDDEQSELPLDALVVVEEDEDSDKMSSARRSWLCCTWCLTWWVPTFALSCCGRMTRRDIQIAWREKLALNILIYFLCLCLLFFIVGLGRVMCPAQQVLSKFELTNRNSLEDPWVSAYGRVYQISDLLGTHKNGYGIQEFQFSPLLGTDVSDLFYKVPSFSYYCPDLPAPPATWDNLLDRHAPSSTYYPHRAIDPATGTPKYYLEYMNKFARARLGWDLPYLAKTASVTKKLIAIYDNVYDVSSYFNSDVQFLGPNARDLFSNFYGKDATPQWRQLAKVDPKAPAYLRCMNAMFYIGTVDRRNDFRCQFSNYILLATSILLFAVIGVKFLAALQFSSTKDPESHDKFCICQVTVYTEGMESIQKTLESIALMRYDDKRKLLFIICDGVVVGSGNDRSTPRIVLDLLGVDPSVAPRSYRFQSIGEGENQLNLAKVFSGLYRLEGHAVPFVVVVKVGKKTERGKPGNRGKRDSQMVLMRFLSRVHFGQALNPLELELYRHMKLVIGVPPGQYEFLLMVDADTEASPDSLNRMVSAAVHDSSIIGICGETKLSNAKDSWVTMIQVYDYYISHHLAKAFESLFGTVTCLPGCFSMYRLKSASKNMPVLISPTIIKEYSTSRIDTLHLKNLLSLGEDRYLTTLMLKHFPTMKLCFTQDAQCKTVAPDRWSILLSQRRRWINSTIHNLLELLFLPDLCGFCCFSMRFVIFMDLFSSLVQPVGLLYILYLVYSIVFTDDLFPTISLILLGVIYGLQVVLFLLKRQWDQILWMVLYLLAFPLFSFYLPIFSFWRFDDFSWGSTRVVVGDNGKRYLTSDVKKFDPSTIPLKSWEAREQELLERGQAGQPFFPPEEEEAEAERAANRYSGRHKLASRSAASMLLPDGEAGRPVRRRGGEPVVPADMVQQAEAMSGLNGRLSTSRIGPHQGMERSRAGVAPAPDTPRPAPFPGVEVSPDAGPPDEELLAEIRRVLSSGKLDLAQVTRRQVRTHLESMFECDLTARKHAIHAMIQGVLSEGGGEGVPPPPPAAPSSPPPSS